MVVRKELTAIDLATPVATVLATERCSKCILQLIYELHVNKVLLTNELVHSSLPVALQPGQGMESVYSIAKDGFHKCVALL